MDTNALNSRWDEFLKEWPVSKIKTMTLDQYSASGDNTTFTWWLEYGLRDLGRFTGDSLKTGIYSRKELTPKENAQGRMYEGKYAWSEKYGDTADAAFNIIKSRIINVIDAVQHEYLEKIDLIELPETLKWKIAFHYQDKDQPIMVNVFKSTMLQVFLDKETTKMSELNRKVMDQKENMDLLMLGKKVWDYFNLHESFKCILSGDRAVWLGGYLYGETDNQYQRFISEGVWQSGYGREDEDKSGNNRIPEMEKGDLIVLKSAARGGGSEVTIRSLGVIKKNIHIKGLKTNSQDGRFLPVMVDWILPEVNEKIEFTGEIGGGNWSWTLKKLMDPENIRKLAAGVRINLGDVRADDKPSSSDSTKKEGVMLNQILYGPPGTGKTYNTVLEVVKICESLPVCENHQKSGHNQKCQGCYNKAKDLYKKLKNDGQVEFVTFHQSYGYEEFVEGVRAETRENNVHYEVKEGIFKRVSGKAEENLIRASVTPETLNDETLFEMVYEKVLEHFQQADEQIKLKLFQGFGGASIKSIGYGNCLVINPGEGYSSTQYVNKKGLKSAWLNRANIKYPKDIKSQPSSYYWAVLKYFEKKSETLSVTSVKRDAEKPYVLIIDEINRGNISKIFGELITLIEEDKRIGADHSMTVRLPVSGDEFGVPKNLYIIGTMNTADRSIAMMDTALRRRFEFKEMMPDPELLADICVEGVDLKTMLQTLNDRIEILYDREHTIGHAYFMSLNSESTIQALASVFENKVIPLLAEYFFEDWEKIRMVLGDDQKNIKHQFIKENNGDKKGLFGPAATEVIDWESLKTYSRNADALAETESYIGIYERKKTEIQSGADQGESNSA